MVYLLALSLREPELRVGGPVLNTGLTRRGFLLGGG